MPAPSSDTPMPTVTGITKGNQHFAGLLVTLPRRSD
jgi:hypothetical protein